MNPFGTIDNLPPGCRVSDIGSDDYVCTRCDREIAASEIDDDASEAFCYVCQDCAAEMRTEATE
jgi:hypothetical protein